MKLRSTNFKGIKNLCLAITLLALPVTIQAQSQKLPYKCGFDSPTERAGWKNYQLKSTAYATFGVGNTGSSYLSHDYPVGNSNADSVQDWYVSPPLKVTYKSLISLKANVYVIFKQMGSDYFGLWYSTKSGDPKSGTFKELADFTAFASTSFDLWHDTTHIQLNDTGSAVYIAFKYKEVSNWFTIRADSIIVQEVQHSGIESNNAGGAAIKVYPNPVKGSLHIETPMDMGTMQIEICDLAGRTIQHGLLSPGNNTLYIQSLRPGLYLYRISRPGGSLLQSAKLAIQ